VFGWLLAWWVVVVGECWFGLIDCWFDCVCVGLTVFVLVWSVVGLYDCVLV